MQLFHNVIRREYPMICWISLFSVKATAKLATEGEVEWQGTLRQCDNKNGIILCCTTLAVLL